MENNRKVVLLFNGAGVVAVPTYAEILRDTYGASEVWPLVNIASGTAIPAFINSARNGSLTGWDLQNAAGPVTGTLAPYSDGVNDFGNLYTANLLSAFNGSVGSFFGWFKTDWSLGSFRDLWVFLADGNNYFQVLKKSTANTITVNIKSGGSFVGTDRTVTGSGWHSIGLSYNFSVDTVKVYLDGSQLGADISGFSAWSGSGLSSTRTVFGADTLTPTNVWLGHLAYFSVKFGSVWGDADFLGMHNDAATAGAD